MGEKIDLTSLKFLNMIGDIRKKYQKGIKPLSAYDGEDGIYYNDVQNVETKERRRLPLFGTKIVTSFDVVWKISRSTEKEKVYLSEEEIKEYEQMAENYSIDLDSDEKGKYFAREGKQIIDKILPYSKYIKSCSYSVKYVITEKNGFMANLFNFQKPHIEIICGEEKIIIDKDNWFFAPDYTSDDYEELKEKIVIDE